MDKVVTEVKTEEMHRLNNNNNSGYHHQSVHQVLNTASFSEDQTATWWQLISSELFLYKGTK